METFDQNSFPLDNLPATTWKLSQRNHVRYATLAFFHSLILMCLQQINDNISQVANTPTRLPMLCYALDVGFLPVACYQNLSVLQANGQLPQNMPWLLGLYWTRRFYEQGRGNNYLDTIGETSFDQSTRAQDVFRVWGLVDRFPDTGNNANLYGFLSECWLITGNEVGTTSKLWKALSAIVEGVPQNCDEDDVRESIARLTDEGIHIPAYLPWRAENGPWLAESIRAIKTGNGGGWLGVIGNNPFWQGYRQRDTAAVAWGLRKDGNRIRWAIRIANVRLHANSSIKVIQSNRTLYECTGERHVLASKLGPEFEPTRPLVIRAGNMKLDLEPLPPLGQSRPLVFRKSRSSSFHRLIHQENGNDEGAEHIQATSLYLLPPGNNGVVCFGNDEVEAIYTGQVTPDIYGQSLYELTLQNFDRVEPKWLSWNGENLLQIGGKPCITATNLAEGFFLRDRPEVLVVFGNSSVLNAANLPQNHEEPVWNIEGGQLQHALDGKQVTTNVPGTIVKATCTVGNTRCQARLIFLPEALQAASSGLLHREGDDWRWNPEADEYNNCAAAENGRVRGRVVFSQQADGAGLEIEASSSGTLWWWETRIDGRGTNFCSPMQDVITFADLHNKRLFVHIPEGMNATLVLNNQAVGAELNAGLNEVQVFDLLREAMNFHALGEMSTLRLCCGQEHHHLTEFLGYPNEPMLVSTDNVPSVFFPQAAQTAQYYAVVVRESALLTGDVLQITLLPANVANNIHPLDIGNLDQNEGCWVLLLPSAPDAPLQGSLLGLAWDLRNHAARQGTVLQVHPPSINTPVPALLQQWNDGQALTEQQTSAIRKNAAFIKGGNSAVLKTIFGRFLCYEDFRSLAGQPTVATEYFLRHLEGRFEVKDLLEPLSRLLHMGFNWLAEPNWISGKECQIESRYRNPGGNNRRNWNNQNGVTTLIKSIPIISAITDIENGCPFAFGNIRVPELREITCRDFNGQNGPLRGVIQIAFGQANHRLHGIYCDGFRGHNNFQFPLQNNQNQCLDFQYHGQRNLHGVWNPMDRAYENTSYSTQIVNDDAAIGHFVNTDLMESMDEAILEDGNAYENLIIYSATHCNLPPLFSMETISAGYAICLEYVVALSKEWRRRAQAKSTAA